VTTALLVIQLVRQTDFTEWYLMSYSHLVDASTDTDCIH